MPSYTVYLGSRARFSRVHSLNPPLRDRVLKTGLRSIHKPQMVYIYTLTWPAMTVIMWTMNHPQWQNLIFSWSWSIAGESVFHTNFRPFGYSCLLCWMVSISIFKKPWAQIPSNACITDLILILSVNTTIWGLFRILQSFSLRSFCVRRFLTDWFYWLIWMQFYLLLTQR